MNIAALGRRLPFDAEQRHHGLQLAATVLIAYAASALLGLPEHLWAVMSALIVLRPSRGATWEASWDRTLATLAGALGGLLGVYLQHHGSPPLATLLAIVAGLSFVSAASPALRSAPIAALIILGAGHLAGHSALALATLRVEQILIGVAVAMAVALASARYRASDRFLVGCAALLRKMSRHFVEPRAAASAEQAEKSAAAVRAALARLALLAGSADRESRLPFRLGGKAAAHARSHRRIATLTARVVQDTTLLSRLLGNKATGPNEDAQRQLVTRAAGATLSGLAALIDRRAPPMPAPPDAAGPVTAPDPDKLLEAALQLLRDDARQLAYLFRLSVDNTV